MTSGEFDVIAQQRGAGKTIKRGASATAAPRAAFRNFT